MLDLNGTGLIMTAEEKDIVAMVHEFVLKDCLLYTSEPSQAEHARGIGADNEKIFREFDIE